MTYSQDIQNIINALNVATAKVLSKRISISFVMGWNKSGVQTPLSQLQKKAIGQIASTSIGYMQEYNYALGNQIKDEIKKRMAEGAGYEDIKKSLKPYIEDVFKNGVVEIDNRGKTRIIWGVDKNGNIFKTEKVIENTYSSTIENYADLTSRTSLHQSYEKGRAEGYKAQGIDSWVFTGPNDERARVFHIALLGNVYKYGTPESDAAESILAEINCRHRAIPYMDNPAYDLPQSHYDEMKDKAGLYWDDSTESWALSE